MLSMKDYKELFNFICDKEPDLKYYNFNFIMGKEFSIQHDILQYNVEVAPVCDDRFYKFMKKYLQDKINDNYYWIVNNTMEIFSFLHEIGHAVFEDYCTNKQYAQEYNKFKTTVYHNHYEAFVAYREIEGETIADNFAIGFINKHLWELGQFCNKDMSIQELKEICDIMN